MVDYHYFISLMNDPAFREQLKTNELKGQHYLEFAFEDIDSYNENLSGFLRTRPSEVVPLVRNYNNRRYSLRRRSSQCASK